jgi:hypothetical protein
VWVGWGGDSLRKGSRGSSTFSRLLPTLNPKAARLLSSLLLRPESAVVPGPIMVLGNRLLLAGGLLPAEPEAPLPPAPLLLLLLPGRPPVLTSRAGAACCTSHYITSHHITSHHITSHHITSHHITLHHITLHHITSHHITSHHITSHYITSHHITSHHITSHHIREPEQG